MQTTRLLISSMEDKEKSSPIVHISPSAADHPPPFHPKQEQGKIETKDLG